MDGEVDYTGGLTFHAEIRLEGRGARDRQRDSHIETHTDTCRSRQTETEIVSEGSG